MHHKRLSLIEYILVPHLQVSIFFNLLPLLHKVKRKNLRLKTPRAGRIVALVTASIIPFSLQEPAYPPNPRIPSVL